MDDDARQNAMNEYRTCSNTCGSVTTSVPADSGAITLDKDTVSWGDTVNVTVTGLDTTKGYYLLFCEAHPKKFPICVKNGKNAKSHLRINNNVTDAGGVRINKDGVATSPLEITKKDTTLTGPVPNPFVITCATGCRIALTYDCLLYTSPSPRDLSTSRMPSSA